MAQFPSLPLWTDAYLGDTTHLTTLEHGAYLLLLIAAWRSPNCRLPNDDKMLARYTKLTPTQWKRIKPMILSFFDEKDNWLYQGRLSDESSFVKQKSKRQSDKAKARWLKYKQTPDAVASSGDSRGNTPTPTPTPIVIKDTNVSLYKTRKSNNGKFKLKDDWKPNGKSDEIGASEGYTAQEIEWASIGFKDYWIGEGKLKTKTGWDRSFYNWLRSSITRKTILEKRKSISNNNGNRGFGEIADETIAEMERQGT